MRIEIRARIRKLLEISRILEIQIETRPLRGLIGDGPR